MCTPVYREFFQNVHNENNRIRLFYILKMLYLVSMCLCMNLKYVQVKLFKAAKKKHTNISGEEKTDLTK